MAARSALFFAPAEYTAPLSAPVAPSVPNHDFVTQAASTSAVAATSPFAASALAFLAFHKPTPPLPMAPIQLIDGRNVHWRAAKHVHHSRIHQTVVRHMGNHR